MSKYEKTKIFLLGILAVFIFMFLLGASGCSAKGGRYQIATVSHQYISGIYVLDTQTGVVSEIPVYPDKHCVYYPEEFPTYKFRVLSK